MNAMAWVTQIEEAVRRMHGRPLSNTQRSAVIGVLLTLDPSSPFYVAKQFAPKDDEESK
jgi:hypothetical protein